MTLYTIGFTQKPAEHFFGLLRANGITCLLDTRLHPGGQLSGFAKQADLTYFLRELVACQYEQVPALVPSDDLLKQYRKDHDWAAYADGYRGLLEGRNLSTSFNFTRLDRERCCLLCSEHSPARCHRRLAAELLALFRPGLEVVHL